MKAARKKGGEPLGRDSAMRCQDHREGSQALRFHCRKQTTSFNGLYESNAPKVVSKPELKETIGPNTFNLYEDMMTVIKWLVHKHIIL